MVMMYKLLIGISVIIKKFFTGSMKIYLTIMICFNKKLN